MEAQWALVNQEYPNYEEAEDGYWGVLKIGRVMMLAEEDNPSLAPIVAALPSVRQPGQTAFPEEPIIYNNLFSDAVDDYYAYNGSSTTPPCSEPVEWLVYFFQEGISKSQLAEFRKLQTTNGPMVNNYRQLQKRLDRGIGRGGNEAVGVARQPSPAGTAPPRATEQRGAANTSCPLPGSAAGVPGLDRHHTPVLTDPLCCSA
ncbi:carbonic anhydrase 6-like [Schistocerca cancellata]|uniref:carbonic anhydrase 6-like n=1 Tax=Schistocerca cancellata TaxID=274614 RepID=UPI0021194892|nr:carbonic anhydrase 6-like [Schistocerca cancellata]